MTQAAIVVIIPAYNAAATISRAIASALAEPEVGMVLVVDDCSTDNTADVVRAADDGSGRVSLHRLESNQGPSAARNVALARSGLPLVALLDADDYLLPGRFARLLAAAGEDWDFVADNIVFVQSEAPLPPSQVAELTGGPARTRHLELGAFVDRNLARRLRRRAEWGFVKPLFRRSAVEALGLAYDPTLRLGEDYVFYCQALMRGARFVLLSTCGYVAVERAQSLSGRHRTADLAALAEADRALIAEARARAVAPPLLRLLGRHLAQLGTKIDVRRAIDLSHARGRLSALAVLSRDPWRLAKSAAAAIGDRIGGLARPLALRKLFADDTFG